MRSLGKNVYAYKMQSLIIGGLFGALAGFMIALRSAAINPSLLRHRRRRSSPTPCC